MKQDKQDYIQVLPLVLVPPDLFEVGEVFVEAVPMEAFVPAAFAESELLVRHVTVVSI